MASIIKANKLQDFGGNSILTSDGSGVVTPNASGIKNTPAFQAYRSSDQSTTSGSFTKLQLDTEDLDTGGYFDNSTNYRYTPLIAGKYFVYVSVRLHDDANDLLQYGAKINKNTSTVKENYNKGTANERGEITLATIIDMNGTDDYLEFYSWQVAGSGNPTIKGDSSNKSTSAGAYKLIGA